MPRCVQHLKCLQLARVFAFSLRIGLVGEGTKGEQAAIPDHSFTHNGSLLMTQRDWSLAGRMMPGLFLSQLTQPNNPWPGQPCVLVGPFLVNPVLVMSVA